MLEGVQNHVLDLLRKGKFGPFYFSSKFMIMCQKANLVHFQIVRKSKFGLDSEKNLDQTWFFQNISHVIKIIQKDRFGPDFSPNLDQTCLFEQFESGPNLPFDTWS